MNITIYVFDRKGKKHTLKAPADMSLNLMELCKSYKLPILGTCGGMAMCASCHCYVTSKHILSKKSDNELAMLSETFHLKEKSRLACQIVLTKELEALEVTLAPED